MVAPRHTRVVFYEQTEEQPARIMTTIAPKLTLFDVCGPGYVFNSRIPDNASEWVVRGPGSADAVTGNQLIVVGPMPVLCSARVATHAGLALLRDIGFTLEADIVTFTDATDRLNRLKSLADKGLAVIDQHVQPDANLHPGTSWVSSSTLSFLNNKGNLGQMVPPPYLPSREVCDPSALPRYLSHPGRFPLVVKAATEESTGGGDAVRLCHSGSELKQAQELFSHCENVVVEDFMAIQRNLCLNYVVFSDGQIKYLGATHQIVDAKLNYQGNWLGPNTAPPSELIRVGYGLMTNAWHRGYRGFAGFDAAVMDDGSCRIYDLNFRFNGSTTPLLIYEALVKQSGLPIAKYRVWMHDGSFHQMIASLEQALDIHCFFPFCIYDPGTSATNDVKPRVSALLFGMTTDEVQEKETELGLLGFH